MSDWIKTRGEEIRRAEKEKKDERDRQTTAASVLKAKADPFWNELVGVLDQRVKDFNAEFPEPERRIDQFEKVAGGLTIRRTAYPSATVKAHLSGAGTSVHYSISRTLRKGMEPVEKQANFGFGVVDGGIAYLEGGVSEHEDVAKAFLDVFFEF